MAKKLARKASKKPNVKAKTTRAPKKPAKSGRRASTCTSSANGKADGNRTMKDLLGGKGSGLAEMTNAGLPVPPGIHDLDGRLHALSTSEGRKVPAEVERQMLDNLAKLEKAAGAKLGDVEESAARVGPFWRQVLDARHDGHDPQPRPERQTVEGLKALTSNGRFAFDSYRRFIQMFGNVVLEIPKDAFEHEFEAVKKERKGVHIDTDLDEAALRDVVDALQGGRRKAKGKRDFPQDPLEQLRGARDAVFRSWNNARAIEYRRIYEIPDSIGTAVNVQMMVFGNTGDRSATGVGFTRNPATGAKEFYGEFLVNAQGEDVVAGIRTPQPISELEKVMPKAYKQLREITTRLEKHYKDVQDFEFTIQDDRLFMLQTRNGKRTGYAAVVIATDLVSEKLITPKEAVLQVDPESVSQLLAPVFDPKAWKALPVATKGLAGVAGRGVGPGGLHRRRRRRVDAAGEEGHPRPQGDRA